jgi:hypothetical protein
VALDDSSVFSSTLLQPEIIDIVRYYDSMLLASECKVCLVCRANQGGIDRSRCIDAALP